VNKSHVPLGLTTHPPFHVFEHGPSAHTSENVLNVTVDVRLVFQHELHQTHDFKRRFSGETLGLGYCFAHIGVVDFKIQICVRFKNHYSFTGKSIK
jgi:hypothetical protein